MHYFLFLLKRKSQILSTDFKFSRIDHGIFSLREILGLGSQLLESIAEMKLV